MKKRRHILWHTVGRLGAEEIIRIHVLLQVRLTVKTGLLTNAADVELML